MTEREPVDREQQARVVVGEALRCTVALVTARTEGLEVPPALLLEGSDPALVCQFLATMCTAMLDATQPDGGRALLVRIGRIAAEDPE